MPSKKGNRPNLKNSDQTVGKTHEQGNRKRKLSFFKQKKDTEFLNKGNKKKAEFLNKQKINFIISKKKFKSLFEF